MKRNKKNNQKQPFKVVLRKRCSENMQQIYRRTPMPKCDSNKVAKNNSITRTMKVKKSTLHHTECFVG